MFMISKHFEFSNYCFKKFDGRIIYSMIVKLIQECEELSDDERMKITQVKGAVTTIDLKFLTIHFLDLNIDNFSLEISFATFDNKFWSLTISMFNFD